MARGQPKADSRSADNNLGVRNRKQKKEKKAKDPNKPKRPASAFLVFMEEFRPQFKEANPGNKSVAVVGKAGGSKWKSLTTEEKEPYVVKAEKRKQEYDRQMVAYNRKAAGQDEESDKSKSEVNDEEEEGSVEGEEDEE